MKTCSRCKKSEPEVKFSDNRRVCNACGVEQRNVNCSRDINKFLDRIFIYTRNRAQRRGTHTPFEITRDYVKALWKTQEGLCALSKLPMTHHWDGRGSVNDYNVSIDRIFSDKGYVKGNIQLVCTRVNAMKNHLDEASLYWWVKVLSNNMSPEGGE